MATDPTNYEARNALGALYVRLGRTRDAATQFESALALAPTHAVSHYNMGVLAMGAGRVADARAHFDSHSHHELKERDKILVRRCPHSIRLLHPLGHNYYHMLREKLHWSETL